MEALMAQTIWQTWVSLNIVKLLIWDFVLEMSIINHNRVGLLGGNWTRCIWERRVKKWFVMSCCPSVSGTMWVACLSGGGSGGGAAEALQTGGWLEATAPDTNITLLQCCSRRCSCTQPAPPPPTRHVWPAEVKKPLSVITSGLTFLPLRMWPRNFIQKNKSVSVLFLSIGNWKNLHFPLAHKGWYWNINYADACLYVNNECIYISHQWV